MGPIPSMVSAPNDNKATVKILENMIISVKVKKV
jgi:hypothetical protein